MKTEIEYKQKRAGGEEITRKLTDVNESAADSTVAAFVVKVTDLSKNTLTAITKVERETLPIVPATGIFLDDSNKVAEYSGRVTISGGSNSTYVASGDEDNVAVNRSSGNYFVYNDVKSDNTIVDFSKNDTLIIDGEQVITGFYSNYEQKFENGSVVLSHTKPPSLETYLGTSSAESVVVAVEDGKVTAKSTKSGKAVSTLKAIKPKHKEYLMDGVNAGAGVDTVSVQGGVAKAGLSIAGGRGDDLIIIDADAGGNRYVFNSGDGSDTIQGWHCDEDILIINDVDDASIYTSMAADGNTFYIRAGSDYVAFGDLNYGDKVKVSLGGVAGSFREYTVPKLMQGTGKSESILNSLESGEPLHQGTSSSDYFVIDAGAGNDSIANTGSYISIYGGDNNDSIVINANNGTVTSGVTIRGGAGNDTIDVTGDVAGENVGGHVYEFGAADGYDSIFGYNSNDTIMLIDVDNDAISSSINAYSNYILYFGEARVTIVRPEDKYLGGTRLNIFTKSGENAPVALADSVFEKIAAKVGDHYEIPKKILMTNGSTSEIFNHDFDNYTIDAAAGADTLDVSADFVSIFGGDGNDSILSSGDNVTICGGLGNDTISLVGEDNHVTLEFGANEGSDSIFGYHPNAAVVFTDFTEEQIAAIYSRIPAIGIFAIYAAGTVIKFVPSENKPVDGTKLSIFTKNGENAPVKLADSIFEKIAKKVGDHYEIPGTKVYYGTMDNESLTFNHDFDYFTISASGGNDTLDVSADFVSINGGSGNDSILSSGDNVTICGGLGNDTISLVGEDNHVTLEFGANEGSDVVYGFNPARHLISIPTGIGVSKTVYEDYTQLNIAGTYVSLMGIVDGDISIKVGDEVEIFNIGGG